MTSLEKRLITAMNIGITIEHMDGHRWIQSHETEYFNFDLELSKNGIALNNKIYGTVEDALDIIDYCLMLMGKKKLEDGCWFHIDDIIGTYKGFDMSRITITENGKGGVF